MSKRYVFKALDAVSATGPGPTLFFNAPASITPSWQIVTTGSPSSVAFSLEITLNGTDFTPFSSGSGEGVSGSTGTLPMAIGCRANLTTLAGGTSPTATVLLGIEEHE